MDLDRGLATCGRPDKLKHIPQSRKHTGDALLGFASVADFHAAQAKAGEE